MHFKIIDKNRLSYNEHFHLICHVIYYTTCRDARKVQKFVFIFAIQTQIKLTPKIMNQIRLLTPKIMSVIGSPISAYASIFFRTFLYSVDSAVD